MSVESPVSALEIFPKSLRHSDAVQLQFFIQELDLGQDLKKTAKVRGQRPALPQPLLRHGLEGVPPKPRLLPISPEGGSAPHTRCQAQQTVKCEAPRAWLPPGWMSKTMRGAW